MDYGIKRERWLNLSVGAGLTGARQDDPMALDYVVAFWLNHYYEQYQNWNLVAVAWLQGDSVARSIAFQTNKQPAAITMADIQSFDPEVGRQITSIMTEAAKLGLKGWEYGMDEIPPLNQLPTTVITGTPRISQDIYGNTVRELVAEQEAERKENAPSAAEMLFAQLDTLSGVVTGGEGRVDWRTDWSEIKSGGDVQQMEDLERPEAT
jgi:hypothetical protein